MKFLVTGGAGFIGGNFLHIMVNKYPNDQFVCIDALTYAGNLETLEPLQNRPNFRFIKEDICNREKIDELLTGLNDQEQKVLRMRFGLDDDDPKTLEEIGKVFGVTRERIRQIEAKAIRKLRHPSRLKQLKNFY